MPCHLDLIPRNVRLPPIKSYGFDWAEAWSVVELTVRLAIYIGVFVFTFAVIKAHGRDSGQWEAADSQTRSWYKNLKQPDNKHQSCCGEADAYYADKVVTRYGKNYAIITDTRDDAPLGRPHIDVGTEFEIPDSKMKWDEGNPTGHSVIFIGTSGTVFCFVDNGGV